MGVPPYSGGDHFRSDDHCWSITLVFPGQERFLPGIHRKVKLTYIHPNQRIKPIEISQSLQL